MLVVRISVSCRSMPDGLGHAVEAALGGIKHEGRRCRLVFLLELVRQIHQRLRQQRFTLLSEHHFQVPGTEVR